MCGLMKPSGRWSNMMQKDQRIALSSIEAQQGAKAGHMEYVLGISLALSFVAALILWSFFTGCPACSS